MAKLFFIIKFSLGKQQLQTANKRATSITVPVGYGFTPAPVFTTPKMKSHDWFKVCKSFNKSQAVFHCLYSYWFNNKVKNLNIQKQEKSLKGKLFQVRAGSIILCVCTLIDNIQLRDYMLWYCKNIYHVYMFLKFSYSYKFLSNQN